MYRRFNVCLYIYSLLLIFSALKKLRDWHKTILTPNTTNKTPAQPKKKTLHGYRVYAIGARGMKVKSVKYGSRKQSTGKQSTGKQSTGKQSTVKDLGARNKRRDGKQRRGYKYVMWDSSGADTGKKHLSHVGIGFKGKMIREQSTPNYCLLCPRRAFFHNDKDMESHYEKVHLKNTVTLGQLKLLKCKCSEVPNRGSDDSTRNAHYHCNVCHKPCDKKQQLATHLITRHDVQPGTLEHLYPASSKKKR